MPLRRALALLLALLLTACAPGDDATPTPTAQDWLDRAASAWIATQSFQFTLSLDGRALNVDEGGLMSFSEAAGAVVAPDRVMASADIQTFLGTAQIGYIAIGDEQWLTNPLSGSWEPAPPDMAAPVGLLFDRERGIGPLLTKVETIERLPDERLGEVDTVRLRGTLPGAELSFLAADLPETLDVELWIGQSDDRVRRIVLTEAESEPPVVWTFDFSAFDAPLAIEPPR